MEQITAGKARLRAQIKELEDKLSDMRKAPLKQEAERLARENTQLASRLAAVEAQAVILVEAAIGLARLVSPEITTATGSGLSHLSSS